MPPIRHLRTALLVVALTLSFAVPAAAVTATGRLQIIHLDVGQGDGAVIISPLGEVAMIDNGVYTDPTPAGGVKVLGQLQALGVTHVKHHFASHYHSDHIGLMNTIFVTGGIGLDYGWDRASSYSSGSYTTYVNVLGSRRRTLVKNQVITLDSLSAHPVTIKVVDLAGAGLSTTDENSLSLALKVSYGEFDMLLAGDAPGSTGGGGVNVESIIGPETGVVEAFKVHHHGSRYSSNAVFLSAIQAKVGVISVGTGNSYGHPTADALTRLHAAGVRTYWTETGAGVAPNATWDKVSNGQVIISATWQGAGVDTIRGNGFADTFTNSGTAPDLTPPAVALTSPLGGELWEAASVQSVTWSASDNVGVDSVTVDYSVGSAGGPWLTVARGLDNTGTVDWTLPASAADSVWVRVLAWDAAGNVGSDSSASALSIVLSPTGVGDGGPAALALARPSPNPSRGAALLRFSLPQSGSVRLEIVDIAGRVLLRDEADRAAGEHSLRWDGSGPRGETGGAGLYFVRLTTPWGTRTQRLVRLR